MGLALIFGLVFQAPASLQLYRDTWLLQSGFLAIPVTTSAQRSASTSVRYRRGDRYAVWDSRGLTVRDADWTFTTRMPDIATSPKLFSRQEILAIADRIASGERSREVKALSGSARIGTDAYFLVRLDDSKGATWLEALVKVDLVAAKPKPILVGRFEGVTLAAGPFDDRLFAVNDEPTAVVRKGSEWGIASYVPGDTEWRYDRLGERIRAHASLDPDHLLVIEARGYGPSSVSIVNMPKRERTDMAESHGQIRLLDGEQPLITVSAFDQAMELRNLASGAFIRLPADVRVRRTNLGLLLTRNEDGSERIASASLVDSNRFEAMARYRPAKRPSR